MGLLLIVAVVLLAYMSIQIGAFRLDSRSVHVHALFDNAAGLSPGAVVSVAGVSVGKIESLDIEEGRARLGLSLSENAALKNNIGLRVRARSMLGEKYLEVLISTQDAPLLANGDIITSTQGQLDIDQMVDSMAPLLKGTDPEILGQALNSLAQAVASDPERSERILADTEDLLHNLRVASEDAPALVADARSTLNETRRVVAEVRPVLDRADQVLGELDTLASTVGDAGQDLPELLDETRHAVAEARGTLAKVDRSSGDLAQVLHNLRDIDKKEIRRWLREEGVLIRLKEKNYDPTEPSLSLESSSGGSGGTVDGSP